jgi:hypothetical protein
MKKIFAILCCVAAACGGVIGQVRTDQFVGCCDASAAVALSDDLFVVANDEDSILRVYSRARMGRPVSVIDLTGFLNSGGKASEVDIEAAARIGDRIYWISSHGRNAKGKEQESRHRFFATSVELSNGAVSLKPAGAFYTQLLDDLGRDARFAHFSLPQASRQAPKIQGALNIEGMAATPEGHLLIGFRNPIPDRKALVVRLLNPDEVISGKPGKFGEPILLDLGGFGIRSMEARGSGYVIVAGASDSRPGSRLFEWTGTGDRTRSFERAPGELFNPEALIFFRDQSGERLMLLSDDGTLRIRGLECKRLKDEGQRRFRVVSIPLDQAKPLAARISQ